MSVDLIGRTAIITGGTRGIGRSIALKLGSLGYRLVLGYRKSDETALETISFCGNQGVEAILVKGDISLGSDSRALIDCALTRFGSVDVLINNAGLNIDKPLTDLTEDDWADLLVPHKYMGPLPAFFYPVFQLVDYAVHSWDIRQGIGTPHALEARSADLLVPLCFVLWSATPIVGPETRPIELGIRVTSGANAGDTRVAVGPDGAATTSGPIDDLPCVIEFDPGSFVLTAYGRTNAGTARGDRELAHRFLGGFFRI